MGEALEPAFHGVLLRGRAFEAACHRESRIVRPKQQSRQASRTGLQAGKGPGVVFSLETKPDLCSALDGRRALAV